MQYKQLSLSIALCLTMDNSFADEAVQQMQAQLSQLMDIMRDQDQQISQLQRTVQGLQGQVEERNHHAALANKTLDARFNAIDTRLSQRNRLQQPVAAITADIGDNAAPSVEGVAATTPQETAQKPVKPTAVINDLPEQAAYQNAFNLLQSGAYPRAIAALNTFIKTHPKSQYADDAQYWLGESYYAQQAYPAALKAFNKLLENHPNSNKRAHALLKMGYAYDSMQDHVKARQVLEYIRDKFPKTSPARLANTRLDQLRKRGF